jgi:transcriptional regulator with PAS, ATPase and Fis domain
MFQHRFCRDIVFNIHPERNYLGSPFDVQMAFSADGEYLAATPATCGQIDILPGVAHGRFGELFDACFEQVLDKLGKVSPPVVQLRLQRDGRQVYVQLAQPGAARQTVSGASIGVSHPERPLRDETEHPKVTLDTLRASDAAMLVNIEKARRTLGRGIPVLIEGETGTGKEWLARAIHNSGPRGGGAFVAINCAAMPGASMEVALFGCVDGGIAGVASKGGPGAIERASGGTLFLDEIGEMPLKVQAQLLRVLQECALPPQDGEPARPDIALVCATRHHLAGLVEAGEFRDDLYYRINGLTLRMPPLRNRSDVLEHAQAVADGLCGGPGRLRISVEVMEIFARHPWPGNLRQLHSVIRAACAMADKAGNLDRQHLPEDFLAQIADGAAPPATGVLPRSAENLKQIELQAIKDTVRNHGGNISAAARQLGVSRTTLYRRLNEDRAH